MVAVADFEIVSYFEAANRSAMDLCHRDAQVVKLECCLLLRLLCQSLFLSVIAWLKRLKVTPLRIGLRPSIAARLRACKTPSDAIQSVERESGEAS